MLTAALPFLFPILMICAALWDLTTLQIPNWLSLAVLISFVAFAALGPLDAADIFGRIGLGAAVLVGGTLLFMKGFAGGGDVKLLAAAAVWVGWRGFPLYLAVTVLIGGVLALLFLAFRRLKLPRSWASVAWVRRLHNPGEGIPYGAAIGVAGVLVFDDLALA